MKFRKSVSIGIDTDSRKSNKVSRIGHMRVTIPKDIRDKIKIGVNDFIEWEVDTTKKTLKANLIRNK